MLYIIGGLFNRVSEQGILVSVRFVEYLLYLMNMIYLLNIFNMFDKIFGMFL